jgi:hypothetical protein
MQDYESRTYCTQSKLGASFTKLPIRAFGSSFTTFTRVSEAEFVTLNRHQTSAHNMRLSNVKALGFAEFRNNETTVATELLLGLTW